MTSKPEAVCLQCKEPFCDFGSPDDEAIEILGFEIADQMCGACTTDTLDAIRGRQNAEYVKDKYGSMEPVKECPL